MVPVPPTFPRHRHAVTVYQFRDALRDAVELPLLTRGVLHTLASWASVDGTDAYPSLARLAASCQLGERAVAKHLEAATRAGYLWRVSRGRRGQTAVYRLCVPEYRLDVPAWREGKSRCLAQPLPVEKPAPRCRQRRHRLNSVA